jgi:2-oxoglutarate ferredoxin oxidoreductase subunit alpha
VGVIRLIVVWPFPEQRIRELASRIKAFVVPEINYGQMVLEVERCAAGRAPAILVPHGGGGVHDPSDICEAILRAAK